jgi:hypothetical protein
VGVQPARTFNLTLQERTIECMLMVASSELGDCLDDFESSQICRVTHRWAPVAAPEGDVQQLGIFAEKAHHSIAIVRVDGTLQVDRSMVPFDPAFQFGPARKTIFARDD